MLVLKNNEGVPNVTRLTESDYAVTLNGYLLNRCLNGEKISLFCPNDVPNLYDLFCSANQAEFARVYEAAEADASIPCAEVDGEELLLLLITERQKTSRIYVCFVDETNTHSPFKDSITQSNLCLEIALPTVPDSSPSQSDGLVSLCTLAAVNVGKFRKQSDLREPMHLLVRFLDAVLSYQDYPVESAKRATELFRPLGIGIINLAHYLAKHDYYAPENMAEMRSKMHEIGDAMYYYGLEATVELAKEYGKCAGYDRLHYADGVLNIDTYKRAIDEVAPYESALDWDSLREAQLQYGVRNATLLALMPSENSSILSNATNGIEPARKLITIKETKTSVSTQVVPDVKRLRKKYKTADTFTNREFIDIQLTNLAILQKYVCQAISTNTYINKKHYAEEIIDVNDLLEQLIASYNLGLKTLYYAVSTDTSSENDLLIEQVDEEGCAGGACKI